PCTERHIQNHPAGAAHQEGARASLSSWGQPHNARSRAGGAKGSLHGPSCSGGSSVMIPPATSSEQVEVVDSTSSTHSDPAEGAPDPLQQILAAGLRRRSGDTTNNSASHVDADNRSDHMLGERAFGSEGQHERAIRELQQKMDMLLSLAQKGGGGAFASSPSGEINMEQTRHPSFVSSSTSGNSGMEIKRVGGSGFHNSAAPTMMHTRTSSLSSAMGLHPDYNDHQHTNSHVLVPSSGGPRSALFGGQRGGPGEGSRGPTTRTTSMVAPSETNPEPSPQSCISTQLLQELSSQVSQLATTAGGTTELHSTNSSCVTTQRHSTGSSGFLPPSRPPPGMADGSRAELVDDVANFNRVEGGTTAILLQEPLQSATG
ncbi:unnamed protein product, partial [Amoebophrya sp. A25]